MAILTRRRAGAGQRAGSSSDDDTTTVLVSPPTSPPPPPPPTKLVASAVLDPSRLEPWRHVPWTVYRGRAYDLSAFRDRHPGGRFLVDLAVHRDATALVESYHLRTEVARLVIEGAGGGGKKGGKGGGSGGGGLLPVIEGFPVDAVEASPRPDDSDFYATVKRRVRAEVFGGGGGGAATASMAATTTTKSTTKTKKNNHHPRRGSERAMLCVLISASLAYFLFALQPSLLTGCLLGLTGAWIGVTVQHCGNHGAMSTLPVVNFLLGFCDDLIGGSSLVWRYHHQVSHHVHTNDGRLDEDVVSMYPLLRFDARLPRKPHHRFQHLYVWLTYPVMHAAFQWGDLAALVAGRTPGAAMSGATIGEKTGLVLGKLLHFAGLLLVPAVGVPWLFGGIIGGGGGGGGVGVEPAHSSSSSFPWTAASASVADAAAAPAPPSAPPAAPPAPSSQDGSGFPLFLLRAPLATRWSSTLLGAAAYSVVLSFVLALMFFVSHNVPENKPLHGFEGEGREGNNDDNGNATTTTNNNTNNTNIHLPARAALLAHPAPAARDWGLQQVLASANWGGALGNFFTGGLNLQIEHHLFPAVAFDPWYPRIARVVKDECARRGVPYASYPSLFSILRRFYACMRELGVAEDEPGGMEATAAAATAVVKKGKGKNKGRQPSTSSSASSLLRQLLPADAVEDGAASAAALSVRAACEQASSRAAAA